jgi:DNA-binding transcriptional MocR family regulator
MTPTHGFIRGASLASTEKTVLYALDSRHGTDGRVFPSLDTIAADTGLNRKTVVKALRSLRVSGIVAVESGRSGRANQYAIDRGALERQSHERVFLSGLLRLMWVIGPNTDLSTVAADPNTDLHRPKYGPAIDPNMDLQGSIEESIQGSISPSSQSLCVFPDRREGIRERHKERNREIGAPLDEHFDCDHRYGWCLLREEANASL